MKSISLTNSTLTFLIDDADLHSIQQYQWYLINTGHGYAIRMTRPPYFSVGHLLLNIKHPEMEPDHIDRDPFNNQRINLRVATKLQNAWNKRKPVTNTSGFKGVTWSKRAQKWTAQIKVNGFCKGLGYYDLIESAAKAYDIAVKKYHGNFGVSNYEPKSDQI